MQFTKEFKLTAIRRLEQEGSIAEVAALEVDTNVLHRWRRLSGKTARHAANESETTE